MTQDTILRKVLNWKMEGKRRRKQDRWVQYEEDAMIDDYLVKDNETYDNEKY